MYPGDARSKWSQRLLPDSRVRHWWDGAKAVGRWYGAQVTAKREGHVEWDAYFLYGPEAEWGEDGPGPPVSWGRTVIGSGEQQKAHLLGLLERDP
jgi:hypothetical protein